MLKLEHGPILKLAELGPYLSLSIVLKESGSGPIYLIRGNRKLEVWIK